MRAEGCAGAMAGASGVCMCFVLCDRQFFYPSAAVLPVKHVKWHVHPCMLCLQPFKSLDFCRFNKNHVAWICWQCILYA